MLSENVMVLTDSNWHDEVIASDRRALIDFWAPWCAPCRMLAPVVDAVAAETSGRPSIPTLILFKGGEAVARHVGSLGREEPLWFVDSAVAEPAESHGAGA